MTYLKCRIWHLQNWYMNMYKKYLFEFLKEIYHKVMSSVLYGYMVSESQKQQSQLVPPCLVSHLYILQTMMVVLILIIIRRRWLHLWHGLAPDVQTGEGQGPLPGAPHGLQLAPHHLQLLWQLLLPHSQRRDLLLSPPSQLNSRMYWNIIWLENKSKRWLSRYYTTSLCFMFQTFDKSEFIWVSLSVSLSISWLSFTSAGLFLLNLFSINFWLSSKALQSSNSCIYFQWFRYCRSGQFMSDEYNINEEVTATTYITNRWYS